MGYNYELSVTNRNNRSLLTVKMRYYRLHVSALFTFL